MKRTYSYAVLGAIIAIAAGLIGAYGLDSISASSVSGLSTSTNMLGHVTLLKHDADGNVIDYRQFDNLITNTGENCVAQLLFGTTATTSCAGTVTAGEFTFIAIGNQSGTPTAASEDQDDLINRLCPSGGACELQVTQADQGSNDGSVALTEATGTTDGSSATVILTQVFNNTGAGGVNVDVNESGIFNSTATDGSGGMFARQTFSNVTLADGESLTVEWTIDIGGTGSIATGEPT